jgi:hypothetical protein
MVGFGTSDDPLDSTTEVLLGCYHTFFQTLL